MKLKILFYCVVVFLFSCKTQNKAITEKTDLTGIPEIVKAAFSTTDSIQVIPNNEKTYILYLSETKSSAATPTSNIKFVVYNPESKQIDYKNEYSNSLLKWFDNSQLLLTQFFGIIEEPTASNKKYFLINIHSNDIKEVESDIINNP